MSELENVVIMLGSFAKTELRGERNVMSIWNYRPIDYKKGNLVSEVFRSLLKTNSKENGEMTFVKI